MGQAEEKPLKEEQQTNMKNKTQNAKQKPKQKKTNKCICYQVKRIIDIVCNKMCEIYIK